MKVGRRLIIAAVTLLFLGAVATFYNPQHNDVLRIGPGGAMAVGLGTKEIKGTFYNVDGDTLDAWIDNERVPVGFVGVRTPMENTDCGKQATNELRKLLKGSVRLVDDSTVTFDSRNRRMYTAYTVGGEPVAAHLVQAGVTRTDGRGEQSDQLSALEDDAHQALRGCVWADGDAPPSIRAPLDLSGDKKGLGIPGVEDEPLANAPIAFGAAFSNMLLGAINLSDVVHPDIVLAQTPAPTPAITLPAGFVQDTVINGGLSMPTNFVWRPDGSMLIAQKNGVVRLYKNGQIQPTPYIDISARVNTYFDHGLIGIALDPNYATNGYVYLLYTYEDDANNFSAAKTGRLGRFTANGDTADPNSESVVLGHWVGAGCSQFPAGYDCIPSEDLSHSVGNIKFAADGTMFVTSGDGASFGNVDPQALRAQDLTSLGGKILHVTTTGQGFSTNPFYTGDVNANQSKVWDYGLRNPYRFNIRPGTNTPYIGNVGWNTWEDINVAVPGKNFGWPCYEGNYVQSGYQAYSQCQSLYTAGTWTPPLISYAHWGGGTAVTMGDFYTGTNFPAQYQGTFFYTDYGHTLLNNVQVDANNNIVSNTQFMPESATNVGIVDVTTGPDGYLYYLGITNSQLFRIRYISSTSPPTVAGSASATYGALPLTVNFSSAGTSDPNGRPLTYDWNFGDGSAHSTAANPSHTYTTKGAYAATLTVTNNVPATNSWTTTIAAGSSPPTATITAPVGTLLYKVGDVINYSGSGTDFDGTAIPASGLSWQIIIHHCPSGQGCHTHYLTQSTGASGSITVPDHGDNVYLEFDLTATNSLGLTNTTGVSVHPQLEPITLNTNPTGLQVVYDGDAAIAPITYNSVIGGVHTLYVPSPQSQSQAAFGSWSDSGAQQHNITVPATGASYTATFNVTRLANRSLALDGSGSATALTVPAHNILGDWTIETWFKDTNPSGYNHSDAYLVMKGDSNTSAEAPYFAEIAWGNLFVGQRTNWANSTVMYGLITNNVTASAWHHLAATYVSSTHVVTVYLDGAQVASGGLGSHTALGNSVPLSIGHNGSVGNVWTGNLDDLRVWNIARAASDIAANMSNQMIGTPVGLVSNWYFDDGSGTTAVDHAGVANATLSGSAAWSADVHGVTLPPTATPTPTNTPIPGTPTATPTPQTCPCTIWPSSATPTNTSANDGGSLEVGVKFQSDSSGYITGIRFYKGAGNGGTHIGNLWTSTGTNLATAAFTSETASGWQQVNFGSPVAITANTTYVASYFAPQGHYAGDLNYFNTNFDRAPLHALSSGSSGGNGLYTYSGTSAFPNGTYNASNYWVDVVFAASIAPTSTPTVTPAATVTPTATNTPIPGTPTATPTNTAIPTNTPTPTQTPTPLPSSCPCTIWPGTASPTNMTSSDTNSIEVGVKFTADRSGYVTGIRFYKLSVNTGTHIGNLWSSAGGNLATATFTGETASGWQQVNFSTPVAVTANTTYVASYFSPGGHYADDQNYFTTAHDNSPLHALADGASGGNGVYAYSSSSAFPNSSYLASNYWVDVVFNTSLAPTPTPTVTPTATNTPTPGTPTATPTASPTPTCPCTIWPSSASPTNPANADGQAVEVGVKFTSSSAGVITGVRFYKGAGNTGTHVGNLWTSTGTLLATATFTGETASGWQSVTFSSPVTITANTTYVASYFAPVGHYAADQTYLNTAHDNPPLHALASGSSGGNGVYVYSGSSAFPGNSYNATNYWVDVSFHP